MVSLTTYNTPPDLNSGNSLYVWIDYNGSTNLLEIFINTTSTKPGSPQLSTTVDIYSLVGSQVYVGFSAGTGGGYNVHDIEDWSFNINTSVPAINTLGIIIFFALAGFGSLYFLRMAKTKS